MILGHHWALSITVTHKACLGPDVQCAMVPYATYTMIHGQFLIGDWVILSDSWRRPEIQNTDHSRSREAGPGWRTEERRPGYCEHYLATRGRRITSWHRGVDRFVTREDIAVHQQLTQSMYPPHIVFCIVYVSTIYTFLWRMQSSVQSAIKMATRVMWSIVSDKIWSEKDDRMFPRTMFLQKNYPIK